eukprot:351505-Chlamydomonas_euryale.AAC.9
MGVSSVSRERAFSVCRDERRFEVWHPTPHHRGVAGHTKADFLKCEESPPPLIGCANTRYAHKRTWTRTMHRMGEGGGGSSPSQGAAMLRAPHHYAVLFLLPAHLGEQVVDDVRANVVVQLLEDAVVAVECGQAATQVRPLLATVPRQLLSRVVRPVVVQVRDHVEPHDKAPVRHKVEVEHGRQAQLDRGGGQHTQHADHACVGREHHVPLARREEVAAGVVVRAGLAWRA